MTKELGAKRCKLLLSPNAEELVEKYTALAETAWISKLAQRICCIHFGFQFGGLTGEKKVYTVSGNTTAMIRSRYGLNRLLHDEDIPKDISLSERLKLEDGFEKKNRDNKKHHALDAMCLCYAPTSNTRRAASYKNILPAEITRNPESDEARRFFGRYLANVIPNKVAIEKPTLEQTIYAKRLINGRETIVKKCNVRDLAYTGINPKYDYGKLKDRIADIVNPVSKRVISDFVDSNPSLSESEWGDWCENEASIPSKSGKPTRLLRVQCAVGDPAEYKDLSKDGCGAYRKGKSHKGQYIWKTKEGRYVVTPVYTFASKTRVYDDMRRDPNCEEICGFFRQNCLVEIPNDVYDNKGVLKLKAGIYRSNTIMTSGYMKVTSPDGFSPSPISIKYLIESGMKRITLDTI